MGAITIFIQKAIGQGMCILFGADGEILTEKSGNLNLGVPGMMYLGGIAGLAAAFMYERAVEVPNAFIGFALAFLAVRAIVYAVEAQKTGAPVDEHAPVLKYGAFSGTLGLTLLAGLAIILMYTGENPFIYFQF